jgi:hypothetical protein
MNVSAPFIVRPIATTLLMIGVTLLGRLKRDMNVRLNVSQVGPFRKSTA